MKIKDIFETMEYGPAPESAIEAMDYLKSHNNIFQLFINGEWKAPTSKDYFDSFNPSNKEKLAKISEANEKDVDSAVKAARKAFPTWSKLQAKERGKYIYRIARLIQERAREFSVIESIDGGKPIRESRDIDIPLAAAHFFYYAGWADKLEYAFPNRKVESLGVADDLMNIRFSFSKYNSTDEIDTLIATLKTILKLKPEILSPSS